MNIGKRFVLNSPIVLGFVFISFCAFILNSITGGMTNDVFFSVYRGSFSDPMFYLRTIGHVFGHANWAHFSGNIILILLLGPLLEEKYGSLNLMLIFAITAIVTGIVHIIFFSSGLLGASGIVFALILLSSMTSMKGSRIPITFVIIAIIYIGGEIINSISVRDNISNLTHIIGGVIGGLSGFLLVKKR